MGLVVPFRHIKQHGKYLHRGEFLYSDWHGRLSQQLTFEHLFSTTTISSNLDGSSLGSKAPLIKGARSISPDITRTLRENINWFNDRYERAFGIAEVREMQNRVIEAENEFVAVTQSRKLCQEKIEDFKERIKNIRDKLDITPRESDNYLKLITEEHKLLREQLSHDAQLSQLKDREQWSLDNLSKLLRQSHELERLRQERSKYWQIISLSLSFAGGVVALIAQKTRNQKTLLKDLSSMRESIENMQESNQLNFNQLAAQTAIIRSLTNFIADKIQEQQQAETLKSSQSFKGQKQTSSSPKESWSEFLLWISGIRYIKSKLQNQSK